MTSRIEQIISEIEEYVDSCKFQQLSNTKIIVNKEELEELLTELRMKTPDEIKRYQKIISNKDAILADAQAKAEERRAMAVASEQEMKAKAQEARAKVIEAEAEVPKAMAEAFRSGNLGIMDYYRMKNIEADTSMRENIAKPVTGNTGNQPLSK